MLGGLFKARRLRQAADGATIDRIADSRDALEDLERQIQEAYEREIYELASRRVEDRVKPATWQAFRLTVLENHSGAEAAKAMNWPVAHVFVAKHRIRKMLEDEARAPREAH